MPNDEKVVVRTEATFFVGAKSEIKWLKEDCGSFSLLAEYY